MQLVNRAGDSLQEIVQSIRSVADIVADIANANFRTGCWHRPDMASVLPRRRLEK